MKCSFYVDEFTLIEKQQLQAATSVEHCVSGNNCCSVTAGSNICEKLLLSTCRQQQFAGSDWPWATVERPSTHTLSRVVKCNGLLFD